MNSQFLLGVAFVFTHPEPGTRNLYVNHTIQSTLLPHFQHQNREHANVVGGATLGQRKEGLWGFVMADVYRVLIFSYNTKIIKPL